MTASIDHPNVIRVYDVGLMGDRAYLVTELLEGETLRARIARGAISTEEAVRIGLEVTKGLAAAHADGLVHRDLKPENIFLTQSGTTKILDFGIAKLAQDETVRAGTSTLPVWFLAQPGTSRPSKSAASPSTPAPICSRSAQCSSKCSPASVRSSVGTSSTPSMPSFTIARPPFSPTSMCRRRFPRFLLVCSRSLPTRAFNRPRI